MGLPTRVRTLIPADLPALAPCESCGFGTTAESELVATTPWARAAQTRFGLVGVALDESYALVVRAGDLPDHHPLAGHVDDADAPVLLALRAGSSGRQDHAVPLLGTLAARLVRTSSAIDAAGGRRRCGCCCPPAERLVAAGFQPLERVDWLAQGAQHLRLDLTRTQTWPDELVQAVGGLRRLARRARRPVPGVSCQRSAG